MICVVDANSSQLQFNVVVDSTIIHRQIQSDFVAAFDLLFKIYFVANLDYPGPLKNFFNFIEKYVYEIPNCHRVAGSATDSLYVNLSNIKL